jgi:peptidoglycan-associated lipoprotein
MNKTFRVIIALALVASLAACAKRTREEPAPVTAAPAPTQTAAAPSDGRFGPEDLDTVPCLRQRTILFDFDRSEVRPEFAEALRCHAKYLQDRPSAMITLEGHADERGSREYNLGLGERRGNAVSSALQANGGSAGQLTVVSYGEERPVCTESNESCWQRNRRVEIVYTAR